MNVWGIFFPYKKENKTESSPVRPKSHHKSFINVVNMTSELCSKTSIALFQVTEKQTDM